MFKKYENGDKVFYACPGGLWKKNYVPYKSLTQTDLQNLENNENIGEIRTLGEDWLSYGERLPGVDKDLVSIPPGTYRYMPFQDPNNPERLEAYPTRKDETYIELPEIELLKTDLKKFIGSKAVFTELGFSYRRGYLLHGRPGNGKTALIRSLLNDPVLKDAVVFWLTEIPSDYFIQQLNADDRLKVIVFEEIVDKYDNLGFSLQAMLAFMDGENSLKNCITIATTNYPQHLGENLANRPSRFDVVLKFEDPSDEAVYTVMSKLLGRDVRGEIKNKSFSFAQVKEIVLLHRMHGCTLEEAAAKLDEQTKQFQRGFEAAKSFGFGV